MFIFFHIHLKLNRVFMFLLFLNIFENGDKTTRYRIFKIFISLANNNLITYKI